LHEPTKSRRKITAKQGDAYFAAPAGFRKVDFHLKCKPGSNETFQPSEIVEAHSWLIVEPQCHVYKGVRTATSMNEMDLYQ
jgi:hypothetical protein